MWVRSLGSIAKQLLTRRRRARVIGISSAGVFIQLNPVLDSALNPVLDLALDAEPASMNRPLWVVFLSPDWMSGPLTLNLPGEAAFFEKIRPGDEIRAGPDELFWLRLNARLELGRAEIWQASPPASPGSLLAPAVRRAYLAQVVQLALADRPASGWSGLLPALAGGGSHPGPGGYLDPTGIPAQVLPAIRTIKDALNDNDSQRLAQALGSLSGLGGGLTPSGDDLTLGFLLASSRWGEILLPDLDRAALAHLVVQRALARRRLDCPPA